MATVATAAWTWGNNSRVSALNPLSWSGAKSLDETAEDLKAHAGKGLDRPVAVEFRDGTPKSPARQHFEDIRAALAALDEVKAHHDRATQLHGHRQKLHGSTSAMDELRKRIGRAEEAAKHVIHKAEEEAEAAVDDAVRDAKKAEKHAKKHAKHVDKELHKQFGDDLGRPLKDIYADCAKEAHRLLDEVKDVRGEAEKVLGEATKHMKLKADGAPAEGKEQPSKPHTEYRAELTEEDAKATKEQAESVWNSAKGLAKEIDQVANPGLLSTLKEKITG